MKVVRANDVHYYGIEQLLLAGQHVYVQPAFDLEACLQQQICVVTTDGTQVLGFACFEVEERPNTLPQLAPSRTFLSSVALAKGRSAYDDVPLLIDVVVDAILNCQSKRSLASKLPTLMIGYGHQQWFIKPLERAGFVITERVETLVLDRLQRRELLTPPPPSTDSRFILRLAQRSDMESIAALDAQAFTPLWHLGVDQLLALWADTHRLMVACDGDTIIGYTAMSQIAEGAYLQGRYVHLSRIATAIPYRRQGVGKVLLHDVLTFAKQQGLETVSLNTQTNNEPSHALYYSMGFAKSGHVHPVMTRIIGPADHG